MSNILNAIPVIIVHIPHYQVVKQTIENCYQNLCVKTNACTMYLNLFESHIRKMRNHSILYSKHQRTVTCKMGK